MELFGRGFSAGYWALVALAAAELIQAAFSMGDLIFVYLRPRVGLRITIAGIGVGIAGGLLLIPPFGITGAALAVLIAYVVRAGLRARDLSSEFDVRVPAARHAGPLVAALAGSATAAGLHAAGHLPPLKFDAWALIGGLLVYAGGVALWLRARGEKLSLKGFVAHPSGV
jgi:O-antigen/teichoic acid export membrane protein